jgi:sterol desaturase/sphingolipid hydroxylase (fatty acid hydroxylase superfamily)
MPPEQNDGRWTLGMQLKWLGILMLVYVALAGLLRIDAPLGRVATTAFTLALWLVLLSAIFIPMEWLLSLRRQPILRTDLLADLGYYFLNGLIPTLFLSVVFGVLGAIARQIIPPSFYVEIGALPIAVQIMLAFAIADFGSYWGHRLMHEAPWLWQFHAIHHEPAQLDWLVNSRAHPIDIIFTRMFGYSLVVIVGLGAPGSGSGNMIAQILVIGGVIWSFFIHANVRLRLGWFEQILSSPHFHHWHHSRDDHANHNYAAILPVYDRMFGTFYMPDYRPPSFGIAPKNRPEALMTPRGGETLVEDPARKAKDAS